MSTLRQLTQTALRRASGLCGGALLSSCFSYHHAVYGQVDLVSHPVAEAALMRWDLAGAVRLLEPRLAANPKDDKLSYTLGCVYLIQSDDAKDRASKTSLRSRGWRLVEAASGRNYHADALLAHAHLVGRWGKKPSSSLYEKHLKLSSAAYKAQPVKEMDGERRIWVELQPVPGVMIR